MSRDLLTHLAFGAVAAQLVAIAGFYLWLRQQYTIGVDAKSGLLMLIAVGVVGALAGYLVLLIRRRRKVR